jgi:hypothetical protein
MTAIMEDNKNSHQKSSCHNGQRQGNPIGIFPLDCINHQYPQGKIGNESVKNLPERFAQIRIPILCGGLVPSSFGHFSFGNLVNCFNNPVPPQSRQDASIPSIESLSNIERFCEE